MTGLVLERLTGRSTRPIPYAEPSSPPSNRHYYSAMRIQVLGPLLIEQRGRTVQLGSPSQRRLVAALAMHHSEVVSIDTLVDVLWPDDPPATARTTVQKYMSRLRAAMGNDVLLSRPPGYVLDVAPDAIDVMRFERLVLNALKGSGRAALDCIDEAAALWRGQPYAEFAQEHWARPTVVRLDELRLVVSERRIELLLQTGAVSIAVVEAEGLCAQEPLREHPHALWMQGLALEGRGTEALRVFDRYRKRIVDEAGMEPSAALVAMEQAVLAAVEPISTVMGQPLGLPAELSSFIGRGREIADLEALVASCPCVTLVGTGGVGKTRLALQVARRVEVAFGEGGWFVDLASVSEPAQVVATISSALRAPGVLMGDPLSAFVTWLGPRSRLIVLDNCEHVLAAVAEAVVAILRGCPFVRILATSREPLGVTGEQLFQVAALDRDAVELFVQRARSIRPGFLLDVTNEAPIGQLCQRLDSLPLAIELAAARCAVAEPSEMLAQLSEGLTFLDGGLRDTPARHRTMRAAIDWSWSLLTDDERRLLAHASVFVGGFTLDAARVVCGATLTTPGDVAGLVAALARKSLLQVTHRNAATRFAMLETVRDYASERLVDLGERDVAARGHAQWSADVGEQIAALIWSPSEAQGGALRAVEGPNLSAGLAWTLACADLDLAMRFVHARAKVTIVGHPLHGHFNLSDVIHGFPGAREHPDAPALWALTAAEESGRNADAAIAAADLADVDGVPNIFRLAARWGASAAAMIFGRVVDSQTQAQRARELVDDDDDPAMFAMTLAFLAQSHFGTPEFGDLIARARATAEHSAMPSAMARCLHLAAVAATMNGDAETAQVLNLRGFVLAQEVGNEFYVTLMSFAISETYSPATQFRQSADGLTNAFRSGPMWASAALRGAMQLLAGHDRHDDAAVIAGFLLSPAGRLLDSALIDGTFGDSGSELQDTLGIEQPTAAALGGRMSIEQCVDFAVATATRVAAELDVQNALSAEP